MLFNSYPFLFGFLPVVLIGYQVAGHFQRKAVTVWLTLASLAFYAYWRPAYLAVLLASIAFNYLMASLIARNIRTAIPTNWLLGFAIVADLGALCYYKYLFPVLDFFGRHVQGGHRWENVLLPLGISFFTFTQIAYLVDLQEGQFQHHGFWDYALFATFFPHLIAGPILHHGEMMPQFQAERRYRLRAGDLAVGFSWFILGLAKKVLLADRFAPAADAAFAAPHSLGVGAAWAGSLAYALQLYFDFSGYSDMALGLARMFSIDFPLNFSSPYKATGIIDFWQRWHITLTRYINAYVYNPLAMRIARRRIDRGLKTSRKAMATPQGFLAMVATPMFATLFLAGVWHGAGLQFLVFGLLHGAYLTINHAWRIVRTPKVEETASLRGRFSAIASCLLTFAAVLLAQVFFRASGLHAAFAYTAGLLGLHAAGASGWHPSAGDLAGLGFGYFLVWGFPNTQQILIRFKPSLELTASDRKPAATHVEWLPTAGWGLALGLLLFVAVVKMQDPSTFLYFQF